MTRFPPFETGECFTDRLVIPEEEITAFARLTRDENPIHHDPVEARRRGFDGLIASGGHTISLFVGALSRHVSARAQSIGLGCSFRMGKAARADALLEASWRVRTLEPKDSLSGIVMVLDGTLHGPDGETILSGEVSMLLRP